jgi:EPS-associated MarR family transcriptional regulator
VAPTPHAPKPDVEKQHPHEPMHVVASYVCTNTTDSAARILLTEMRPDTVLKAEQFAAKQAGSPSTMASKHPEHTEDLHFRVLRLLQDSPDVSQRELAHKLGVSNGKLHYCMRALIDKGLVKLGNFAHSKHHMGYAYLLTPKGMAQKARMASTFLKRKLTEYEALRAEIAALQGESENVDLTSSEQGKEL